MDRLVANIIAVVIGASLGTIVGLIILTYGNALSKMFNDFISWAIDFARDVWNWPGY